MKMLLISVSLAAATALAMPAQGSVLTIGAGFARQCYEAADRHDTSMTAQDACNRALTEQALNPQDRVATHVNRGIMSYLRGELAAANRDYDMALSLDPQQPEAWLNKGLAALKAGDEAGAMPLFARALDLRTNRPELAWYGQAVIHEDMGQMREAYAALTRARALAPGWTLPVEELKRYRVVER